MPTRFGLGCGLDLILQVLKAYGFGITPETLKGVEFPGFVTEDVDDHIDEIDQNPAQAVEAFHVPGAMASLS